MEKKKKMEMPHMGHYPAVEHHMPMHHMCAPMYHMPAMDHCGCGNRNGFAIIVVLFLLLIIVGTAYVDKD